MANNFVKIDGDFSKLAELIGSVEGWSERVDTPFHISELLKFAHGMAVHKFDLSAAADAEVMGFSHMYEWGTEGITFGNPGEAELSAVNAEAKLWIHRLTGSGASRGIDFVFRPSVREVPLAEEAIEKQSKSGRSFSRHIFSGKAWVMEMGMPVTIKPSNPGGLFIPESSLAAGEFFDEKASEQGYMFYRGWVHLPANPNAGNFQAYWYQWWNADGRVIIGETIEELIHAEADEIIKTGRGKSMKRYASGKSMVKTFNLQIQNAKARAYAESRAWEGVLQGRTDTQDYDDFLDGMAVIS